MPLLDQDFIDGALKKEKSATDRMLQARRVAVSGPAPWREHTCSLGSATAAPLETPTPVRPWHAPRMAHSANEWWTIAAVWTVPVLITGLGFLLHH